MAEQVQKKIVSFVFDKLVYTHGQHFRECSCSYCLLKQEATIVISDQGHIPYYTRDTIRHGLRLRYRKALREELDK